MNKLVIIAFLVPLLYAQCSLYCANSTSCSKNSSAYACTACPENATPYFFSCQQPSTVTTIPFVIITVIVALVQLFMLFVGIGVYHDIFQNLQLATLITWKYGFEGGTSVMQGTNLAILSNNSFTNTYAAQFLILIVVLAAFWMMTMMADRISHNSTAILIRRKKIIFPVRLITLLYNMLFYSCMVQITTTQTNKSFDVFSFVLAIVAIIVIIFILIGIGVTSNWKRFQVEDPHYYVLLQEMTSKKWYAKNNILFSLILRGVIIVAFTTLFQQPQIAGIIMVITQIGYTLYIIVLIRYTKIRYFVFIVLGNVIMIGIILVSFIGAVSTINSDVWNQLSSAYLALLVILAAVFFGANTSQMMAKKDIITKQLRSFYGRFIICEKSQETVAMTKYDEHSHRQRVTEFKTNLLYRQPLADSKTVQIELTPGSAKKATN